MYSKNKLFLFLLLITVSVGASNISDRNKRVSGIFEELSAPRIEYVYVLEDNLQKYMNSVGMGWAVSKIDAVAEKYAIDRRFIAAVMCLESGLGKSRICREKNNYFGLNARDSNPYKYAFTFKTAEDSIEYFGSLIRDNYINKGKETLKEINERYATDKTWHSKVLSYMKKMT
jgi:hypothetical protein